MDHVKKLQLAAQQQFRHHLRRPIPGRMQVICGNYGSGKTHTVMDLADGRRFPVLLGFFTRELRDESFRRYQRLYSTRSALLLESPMERLAREHDVDERAFYAMLEQNPGTAFQKVLGAYLRHILGGDPDRLRAARATYQRASREFYRGLQDFFDGHHDILCMTQQGLLLRLLHGTKIAIPNHINVVFDELEVGLWTEGWHGGGSNPHANRMLAAGGRWTILTGDTRPGLLGMREPFEVVDLTQKQLIDPITLRTGMPLGRGDKLFVPKRARNRNLAAHYRQLVAKRNHHNREIALPLIIAEERARAKRDGKKLLVVGNVGQQRFRDLRIRTFESLKGANWLHESRSAWRIVVLGTCPAPEELARNSRLFGSHLFDGYLRGSPGRLPLGYTSAAQFQTARQAQWDLLDADVLDKVAQVIARVRGYRNRPDCDVVVYLWKNANPATLRGKLPYVYLNPTDEPPPSLVGRLYEFRKPVASTISGLADELIDLRIGKRALRVNSQYRHIQHRLRRNLGLVCDELIGRGSRWQAAAQDAEIGDLPEMDPNDV